MKSIKFYISYVLLTCCLFIGSTFGDNLSDTNRLLDWAEAKYLQIFSPAGQTTKQWKEWLYRYYPSTQIYAGVNINDFNVYVRGDVFGGLKNKGQLANMLAFTINPTDLNGTWWQPLTRECVGNFCTATAFLYNFNLTNCVENTCSGTRQNWIDNGNGWKAPQALPFSFAWTLKGNILQLSFSTLSGRVETYTINADARGNTGKFSFFELSSNEFDKTLFLECGSIGFPTFIAQTLGCL